MADLIDIADLFVNGNVLKKRILGACLQAAWDIQNESAGTDNHENRLIWANAVLSGVDEARSCADDLVGLVLSNATIQASGEDATDNDVQFVVNSLIDTVADGS